MVWSPRYDDYKREWLGLPPKKKICEKCATTENVTNHHLLGGGKGPKIYLCRDCHDEEDGMNPHVETAKALQRRIHRAKRRVKRDLEIIRESEEALEKLEDGNHATDAV